MQKCLLLLILSYILPSIYQPIYGQKFIALNEGLVKDSWSNAGNWFTQPTDINKSALIGIGALGIVSGTMLWDNQLQPQIALGNVSQSSVFSQISEPFGNPLKMGILALGSYYTAGYLNNKTLKGASSAALQAMLTAGIAAISLKLLVHRVRPEEQSTYDPYDFLGASFSRDNLSFPSGHSTIAFALASSLSSYYENDLRVAIPLYALASATAIQRVYDLKHWPSDVVAGAFLGAWIGNRIGHWQNERDSPLRISMAPNPWGGTSLNVKLKLD